MTECITTPGSCERRPTVAILGAGIAGLTAAHELAERGFDVTVYEYREDERNGLDSEPAGFYPPVKLGGLAASQYSTVGTHDGSHAELRPFPGRRGKPRRPARAVAGEHGFRFFPAYYLHTWDLFQRIPVYQAFARPNGEVSWQPTSRTVLDNVRRVVTQGTTVEGKPSLVFPREAPRSPAEFLGIVSQLAELGFTAADVGTFVSRLVRYLTTSPLRRAKELQNLSAYDYFVGRDDATGTPRFSYTPPFDELLREMPRVLAAFDSRWGDARTNLTTYLQLQLQMDRRDNKADGVLNGPTTESWFDHWYRHLIELGVSFVRGAAERLDPPAFDPDQPPHLRPRVQITLGDGTRVAPDYTVVAVDAPAAEIITEALRNAGTGGTVGELDGFSTSVPPAGGPLEPDAMRPQGRRDPYAMDQMGRVPWDRFQTLGGIQYFFDTEFQLLRGHMYYSGTEWALSSINQHGMWERRPTLARDGHVSVLSVDIGDFNTPSRHLVDELGRGKAARDCTADEIAAEVWRQIASALTSNVANVPEALLPWPSWFALDRGLIMAGGPGQGGGRAVRNETPYLVPIIGDWPNRPGRDPWNPHNTSWGSRPPEDFWLEDLEQRNVWQARHGGYQVHNNSVVFAGTWTKTFTRMTSMEAAGESGRHAVNAVLDHYIWVQSGGLDRRETTTLSWRFPYGFLDQGMSSPVRMPTPAGDYCYVFDIENREPPDTRALRVVDSEYCQESLPHPLDPPGTLPGSTPTSPATPTAGGRPMTPSPSPMDESQPFFAYLQAWRQLLEPLATMASGMAPGMTPGPSAPWAIPTMPPAAPFMPPTPPMPSVPGVPAPTDYAQHLFGYLQAWRQYLEHATGAGQGPPPPVVPSPTPKPEQPSGQQVAQEDPQTSRPHAARATQVPVRPGSEYESSFTPSLFGRGPDAAHRRQVPPGTEYASVEGTASSFRRVSEAVFPPEAAPVSSGASAAGSSPVGRSSDTGWPPSLPYRPGSEGGTQINDSDADRGVDVGGSGVGAARTPGVTTGFRGREASAGPVAPSLFSAGSPATSLAREGPAARARRRTPAAVEEHLPPANELGRAR
ncbi:FAD-dependent oxidoreductase [Mycolicibacterium hodleri]|uniref:FAD-dependent oxidoreductase n=1 Tax=Mycolicibacterium hodleri TaxID=49897 RepID=A0A502EDK2_9MYCO|nr:FAD-dependent oxidoreductase [Mycolicibacterium hodleri]TPG34576.1 FAD-dependent oxidoreductase [Mycolicibacterium hodleri]